MMERSTPAANVPDSDGPNISVVVPVHNEAGNIAPQLADLFAILEQRTGCFEVIYVDDGSSDGTAGELGVARQQHGSRLRVIFHDSVCGQSTALYTGVRAARHDWIVTLDGDGQNDPADIPTILDAATRSGSQKIMVCGHRVARRDSTLRRLSSRAANAVRRRLLGDGTPDSGCGLKAFPRELFLQLPYFDHMHRFLPSLVLRQGGHVESIPVSHRPRLRGRSKYGLRNRFWVGIVDTLGVAWLQRREKRPNQVFGDLYD